MDNKDKKRFRFSIGYVILAFWVILLLQQVFGSYLQPNKIAYSDFRQAVAANKIEEVAVGSTVIHGRFKVEPPAPGQEPATPARPAAGRGPNGNAPAPVQGRPFDT